FPSEFVHHFTSAFAEQGEGEQTQQHGDQHHRPQGVPLGPDTLDKNALIGLHKRHHGVPLQQTRSALGQDARRIDDRCEPEPELQHDAGHLSHIAKKYVEHAEDNAQSHGEEYLNQQYRQHGKHHPAGKIAGHQQKADEQDVGYADDEQWSAYHDHWQADPWKSEFLLQGSLFEEHRLATGDDLGDQSPGQQTGTQIDAVGQIIVHTGQARLQQA